MKNGLLNLLEEGFEYTGKTYAGWKIYLKNKTIRLYDAVEDYSFYYLYSFRNVIKKLRDKK